MLSKEIVERALLVVGAFVVASNAIKIAYELIKGEFENFYELALCASNSCSIQFTGHWISLKLI